MPGRSGDGVLDWARPQIFHTGQGSQHTSVRWKTSMLNDIPSLQVAKERTALRLDGDNGQRAHTGLSKPTEEHGGCMDGPRAPFIEGRLRCGERRVAALLTLAELGKPLLRSQFPQITASAPSRMIQDSATPTRARGGVKDAFLCVEKRMPA